MTAITDPHVARGKVHPLPGVLAWVGLGLMAGYWLWSTMNCHEPRTGGGVGVAPESIGGTPPPPIEVAGTVR